MVFFSPARLRGAYAEGIAISKGKAGTGKKDIVRVLMSWLPDTSTSKAYTV